MLPCAEAALISVSPLFLFQGNLVLSRLAGIRHSAATPRNTRLTAYLVRLISASACPLGKQQRCNMTEERNYRRGPLQQAVFPKGIRPRVMKKQESSEPHAWARSLMLPFRAGISGPRNASVERVPANAGTNARLRPDRDHG